MIGPTLRRRVKSCIYCRVSTSEQDTDNQAMVLAEWAQQRGYEVFAIYREEESAWRAGHQRELARLVRRRFGSDSRLDEVVKSVQDGETDPYSAAEAILESLALVE